MKGQVWDQPCESDKYKYYCVCKYQEVPILILRGLCSKSVLDTHYTLYQKDLLGFRGLEKTKVFYDENMSIWTVEVINKPSRAKIVVSSGYSLLLGAHTWQISNDSTDCNAGEPYSRVLKLTGCAVGQFTCKDGQCVNMTERCDQLVDCRDKSDEVGCSIIQLEENYDKNVPPVINASTTAKVNVSLLLLSVNDISEVDLTIELKFSIILEWYETDRVSYNNLKPIVRLNALSSEEMSQIWTPYAIYANTDQNEAVKVQHKFKDVKTTVAVTKEGNFTRSGINTLDEKEIYKAS